MWYNMTGDNGAAEVAIFGDIGFEVTAQQFAADLKALGEVQHIALRINSGGGSIIEGTAIFNILLKQQARITAHVEGWAASMASVIAMAADEIIIPENAWMVIHNPWTLAMGDAEDLRKNADLLDRMKNLIVEAYMRHAKIDRKEIEALMDAETWMNGAEAVAKGFATATSPAIEAAAQVREGFAKMPDAARSLFATVEPPPVAAPVEPEPEKAEDKPADPPAPEPEKPDEEKAALKEQNAALAEAVNKAKADLDAALAEIAALKAEIEKANAATAAEVNARNDLSARLAKLTGGLAAPVDSAAVAGPAEKWRALVKEHGYEKARNKFPNDFTAFMAVSKKHLL
jgi:ATP-dependent protease ClpP protease subunit